MNIQDIHERALDAASRYRKAEAELIEILQQAEQHRVFLARGHSCLFLYVVKELGISESVAFNLIAVARKAREIPELKTEIQNGTITLSNARKIVPILSKENKSEWLAKARELSHRQLEKEVVKIRPQLATPERATYVTPSRVRLEFGLSEKDMLKLRRVQDLFCQSRKRSVTIEEVLVALTDDFLKRHDPLEKAKRQQVKTGLRVIESDSSNESNHVVESDRSKRSAEKTTDGSSVVIIGQQTTPNLDVGTIESASGIFNSDTEAVESGSETLASAPETLASEHATRFLRSSSVSVKPVALQVHAPETRANGSTGAEGSTRADSAKVKTQKIHVREPIPVRLLHRISLRDQRRCQFTNARGEKCNQTRWIETHHVIPVSKGGGNILENLTTLCSAHHGWVHSCRSRRPQEHSSAP